MSADHLTVNGRHCIINLSSDFLTARTKTPSKSYGWSRNYSLDIKISEIIAVKCGSLNRQKCKASDINQELLSGSKHFNVHFIKRKRNIWRPQKATFQCKNYESCEHWMDKINRQTANQVTDRPKKLKVFVNPYGGKKKGRKIYKQQIAPLFDLAGIEVTVIETQGVNHAKKLVSETDLSQLDGVVVVGGDGTFAEVVNGLLIRTQEEAGLDPHHMQTKLISPRLKIGIIPAGSTDVVVYGTTGINDPVTSALHIILGTTQPLDICSVHHDGKLLRYSVSFMGYGYFGDLLKDSEERRWMGPIRYDYAGIKKFLGNKFYEGEISFIEDTTGIGSRIEINSPDRTALCRTGCDVCSMADKSLIEPGTTAITAAAATAEEDVDVWQRTGGTFLGINAPIFSCSCKKSPEGMSPSAHLADGTLDLILLRDCSRTQHLRHLIRLSSTSSDHFDFDFVEVKRVKEFKFRSTLNPDDAESQTSTGIASQKTSDKKRSIFRSRRKASDAAATTSVWNIDGEVVSQPDIDVKVHCQLIRLFANGIEAKDEEGKSSYLNCYQ